VEKHRTFWHHAESAQRCASFGGFLQEKRQKRFARMFDADVNAAWGKTKVLQNDMLVQFIEECGKLKTGHTEHAGQSGLRFGTQGEN